MEGWSPLCGDLHKQQARKCRCYSSRFKSIPLQNNDALAAEGG